jgi:HEAT repeat protein
MDKKRRRVIFGPLFYGALILAGSVFLGLGLWSLWPAWRESWELRTYASDLRGPSPLFAERAARNLAKAGPAAVPWLVDAARNPNALVRSLALSTLGSTIPLTNAALQALVLGLRDQDAGVRREAADALGRVRPDAGPAIDALAAALGDSDPGV